MPKAYKLVRASFKVVPKLISGWLWLKFEPEVYISFMVNPLGYHEVEPPPIFICSCVIIWPENVGSVTYGLVPEIQTFWLSLD